MPRRPSAVPFLLVNVLMWTFMTAILIVVPDTLDRWMSVEFARVIGWAIASGLWVVALQQPWRNRVGPFVLFGIQLVLWVGAAVVAGWIGDLYRF
jgi:hypothetical protein